MKKNPKRDGVDKAFNIKIETEFIHPEYTLNSTDHELITDTGFLKVFELTSTNPSRPSFRGRWDHGEQLMDVDILNTDSKTKEFFLKSKRDYKGHKTDFIDKNKRTFGVFISILGEDIYKGRVFFNINHSLHLETATYVVTGSSVELKRNLYNKPMRIEHVKRWFTSEEKFLRTPVGIFLLGAFLGELSPDPTDAIHFWLQAHVLNNPAVAASTRAFLQIFDWYFMSALYFLLLLIIAYVLHIKKVNTVKRITVIGGILSVGLVIGLLAQFFAS